MIPIPSSNDTGGGLAASQIAQKRELELLGVYVIGTQDYNFALLSIATTNTAKMTAITVQTKYSQSAVCS